jgi:hypothetical protein
MIIDLFSPSEMRSGGGGEGGVLYYLGGGVLGGFVNVLFAVIIPGATSAYLLIGFWFHGDGDHE